ncbi:hypothetical protein I4F81_003530 [Pyropia yezoensis]|uniref:Uncharacterized protein n=1 Tax=Pyropia yezoensis TaxID=2788 RepID=A0ACC3BSF6_PYRYE|nr:hypothetical protein I4F81_003530 [Neopyropia yezoensis]
MAAFLPPPAAARLRCGRQPPPPPRLACRPGRGGGGGCGGAAAGAPAARRLGRRGGWGRTTPPGTSPAADAPPPLVMQSAAPGDPPPPPPGDDKAAAATPPLGLVERLFTFFFGAIEAEPLGLKRFDRDRFPELYPATLTETAPPVDGDDAEVATFRPLLARTQLAARPLRLVYDAAADGWTATAFHARVDRGGAIAAFLFTWPDGDTAGRPVKLRKVGRGAMAVIDKPEDGPTFGADAFVVPLQPPRAAWAPGERDRLARSKLGSYYERLPNGRNHLFAPTESGSGVTLEALRVYQGVYAEGEEIPFSDALPFSLD